MNMTCINETCHTKMSHVTYEWDMSRTGGLVAGRGRQTTATQKFNGRATGIYIILHMFLYLHKFTCVLLFMHTCSFICIEKNLTRSISGAIAYLHVAFAYLHVAYCLPTSRLRSCSCSHSRSRTQKLFFSRVLSLSLSLSPSLASFLSLSLSFLFLSPALSLCCPLPYHPSRSLVRSLFFLFLARFLSISLSRFLIFFYIRVHCIHVCICT